RASGSSLALSERASEMALRCLRGVEVERVSREREESANRAFKPTIASRCFVFLFKPHVSKKIGPCCFIHNFFICVYAYIFIVWLHIMASTGILTKEIACLLITE
ncbi:hypothetical protein ACJX0J_015071, partial [Zea mays]